MSGVHALTVLGKHPNFFLADSFNSDWILLIGLAPLAVSEIDHFFVFQWSPDEHLHHIHSALATMDCLSYIVMWCMTAPYFPERYFEIQHKGQRSLLRSLKLLVWLPATDSTVGLSTNVTYKLSHEGFSNFSTITRQFDSYNFHSSLSFVVFLPVQFTQMEFQVLFFFLFDTNNTNRRRYVRLGI